LKINERNFYTSDAVYDAQTINASEFFSEPISGSPGWVLQQKLKVVLYLIWVLSPMILVSGY